MLDHVSIAVSDLARAAAFYDAVLAELGYERRKERAGRIGYGPPERTAPVFWIIEHPSGERARPGPGFHVSFSASDRPSVQRFHATALARGGADAGPPGERPQYTRPFYGAFILDIDGYKIEAVCRNPED
jgi:catechol 2,3-dioxygenase-like lactoylglutathione lyase family enzyme